MPPTERILHIDDDETSRTAMEIWMRRTGFSVVSAASTSEADALLARDEFALILSDIHMPGNERLGWVEHLLATDASRDIVLLTGNPELETALRAANLPIAAYLLKPPDYPAFEKILRRLLTARRQRRELAECIQSIRQLLAERDQATGGTPDVMSASLAQLAASIDVASQQLHPRAPANQPSEPHGAVALRRAITEAIDVLESTKRSFRSAELGHLRRKLESVLASTPL